jgi:hypothetical protein
MGKTWVVVLGAQGQAWGVPPSEITALTGLVSTADSVLVHAKSGERSLIVTAQCKAAFDALEDKCVF